MKRIHLCALELLLFAACAEESKPHAANVSQPKVEAPTKVATARPRFERVAAPEVPVVDPASVAVEEDFVAEAAEHVTKRTDLEAALRRLAGEIATGP